MVPAPEYTPLDETDRAILQLLQRDARNATAVEIGEEIGVSDGTVRNRIEKLEDLGVIEGYVPVIDYERAGYQLEVKIVCSASITERGRLAEEALEVEGVVEVQELMTGRENILVMVVVPTHDDLTRTVTTLHELGLNVEREELLRHTYRRPFNHFGTRDLSASSKANHEV